MVQLASTFNNIYKGKWFNMRCLLSLNMVHLFYRKYWIMLRGPSAESQVRMHLRSKLVF